MTDTLKHYRVDETAEELNVSESTIRRWLANGKLKGWKEGGVVRIERESIDQFVKAHPYTARPRKGRPSPLARLSRSLRYKAS